ncbi:MAG: hypothetical protein DMG51_15530 [Acidobacteria bacterium]|nr:MAG: hypothetical protein DMG51_15530 [Acidobacteriota bacterium]
MALGAASSDVLRLVMGKGLVLVGMGTVIGLAMGFAVDRLINSMLAAYVPARRASRIAPTQALRYE